MAKRFTETKIWDDTWFQELPLIYKTLWWYLFCKCDEAGVWKVNKKLAEFQLGSKISWEKIDSFLNKDKKRIEFYDEIWVLKDFVKFQYGDKILTSDHSFHKQIRKKLDTLSHRVSDRVCHTPIVIVKEKEKVIVKEKDITPDKFPYLLRDDFKKLYQDFLDMRQAKKKPATNKAQDLVLTKLHQHDFETSKEMLNQSIINSWSDVYPLKNQQNALTKQQESNLHGLNKLMKEVHNDNTGISKGLCHIDSGVSGDKV